MTYLGRLTHVAMLAGCLSATAIQAAEKQIELTVDAGAHDRCQCPVTVLIECPPEWSEAKALVLTDGQGSEISAQLTKPGLLNQTKTGPMVRELHFVLPRLGKGAQLNLVGRVAKEAPASFTWCVTPQQYSAELCYDGRPEMRYVYTPMEVARENGDQYFKVFHHLYDPAGTRLVTKGDKDGLYPHHRGLFYGFTRITYGDIKANTWACSETRGPSHQSHQGFLASETGPVFGRHQVAVDWYGPESQVFAKEQRELAAWHVPCGQMIDFASHLSSTVGKVKLDGDPAHAGFQFRAAQEVADHPEGTYYLRPDGKGKPGEFRNWSVKDPDPRCVNLPWYAVSFEIAPKRYTAVYLDRPANPHEARFGERDYARFGCYFEYELDEGKDLSVGYRLWLQEGEMTVDQAAALSTDFVDPPTVTVR